MESEPRSPAEIRSEIDALDRELVELLNRRASLAKEIGLVKGREGKPFFTPEREREVYERLSAANPGPLKDKQLVAIYREIISAARATEKRLVVSYWGPEGTFSHMAALAAFGSSADAVPADSITAVFQAVENEKADYGVVPVENSVAGAVPETLDAFTHGSAKICAELYVPIRHCLVGPSANLSEVKRLYTGAQPAGQCKRWISAHLPKVEIVECMPTARAAERAMNDPEGAAIANVVAAELVGAPILAENIQDFTNNRTRFLVIGANEPAQTGRDRTTMLWRLSNRPGALHAALGVLNASGVNVIMIESRPALRGDFEYDFFVDVEGHRQEPKMKEALEILQSLSVECQILGSYPVASA